MTEVDAKAGEIQDVSVIFLQIQVVFAMCESKCRWAYIKDLETRRLNINDVSTALEFLSYCKKLLLWSVTRLQV